jgi:outer membrane protein TolC
VNRHLILLILILLVSSIWARHTAFDILSSITLDAARERALDHNPAYQAKAAAASSAKWGKTNAISTVLPTLSLSGTYLYMDPATTVQTGAQQITLNNDMRTLSLNLSQPLFLGGKAWQAYKMAVTSEEMARLSMQNQRFTLFSEVEAKYLAALQLKVLYNISQQEIKSAEDNLELAKLKQDNGLLSRADYLRFQSRLAGKQVAGLQAQTALQLALQDFANYLGADELILPEDISMDGEKAMIESLDGFDLDRTNAFSNRLLQVALKRNLNYRLLDKSVELSERAYSIAKASFLPTLMLTGSRQYKENGIDRYEFTASNQIMLNASLPILPGLGYYSAAKKAKEEARKAGLEAKTATDGIKLGIQASTLNWISSAKQVQSAELGLSYTEELYSQMQERFRLNMLSPLELLDAELMLSAARMTYTGAFYNYLKNRSALMQALALEDNTELYTLMEN